MHQYSHCSTKERRRLREEIRTCQFIHERINDEANDAEEGKTWLKTVKVLEGRNNDSRGSYDTPLNGLWLALNVVKVTLKPKR